jgi:hypothetical protein
MSKKEVIYKMFREYPDIVNVAQMRKMLGGIGRNTAYDLLKQNK